MIGRSGLTPTRTQQVRVLPRSRGLDPCPLTSVPAITDRIRRLPAPTRMSGLADGLGIARRSATSLVDELEARHLVARGHDPVDRRAVTIVVTKAGQDLVDEVGERRRRTTVGMLGALSEAELRTLRDLLGRIIV